MSLLLSVRSLRTLRTIPLAVFCSLTALGCNFSVTGSGDVIEESHELDQYDTIALADGFVGRVTQGTEYSVVVRADDNIIDDVVVRVVAGEVFVDLDGLRTRKATLEAVFTLPRLSGVNLRDGSILESKEAELSPSFSVDLSGGSIGRVSQAEGEKVDTLAIESAGGSSFDIEAHSATALVRISGGGTGTLVGSTESMTLSLSGGSTLDAADCPGSDLSFDLSGGSVGNVFMTGVAQGALSGGSVLEVRGGADVTADKSGGSTVSHN